MILIRTTLMPLPEKKKEVLQTLLSIVEHSVNGSGLIGYAIYHDIMNVNVLKLISEWQTRGHMESHLCSDRFGVLLGTGSLLSEPVDVQIFTFSKIEGMATVKMLRKRGRDQVTG